MPIHAKHHKYLAWKLLSLKVNLGLEYFTQTFQYKFKVSRKHKEKIERKNNMPVFTFHLSVAFFVMLNPIMPNFLIKQKPINWFEEQSTDWFLYAGNLDR